MTQPIRTHLLALGAELAAARKSMTIAGSDIDLVRDMGGTCQRHIYLPCDGSPPYVTEQWSAAVGALRLIGEHVRRATAAEIAAAERGRPTLRRGPEYHYAEVEG